jgi:hypothetical protein
LFDISIVYRVLCYYFSTTLICYEIVETVMAHFDFSVPLSSYGIFTPPAPSDLLPNTPLFLMRSNFSPFSQHSLLGVYTNDEYINAKIAQNPIIIFLLP